MQMMDPEPEYETQERKPSWFNIVNVSSLASLFVGFALIIVGTFLLSDTAKLYSIMIGIFIGFQFAFIPAIAESMSGVTRTLKIARIARVARWIGTIFLLASLVLFAYTPYILQSGMLLVLG